MKKLIAVSLFLAIAGSAFAALGDVTPVGLTGLWRFQDSANWKTATVGQDLSGNVGNSNVVGPWVAMGTVAQPGLYSDNLQVQMWSADTYITVNPSFTANGGGSYVNEYTIAFDYVQTDPGAAGSVNSLFQTASDPIGSSSELLYKNVSAGVYQIGHDSLGWSTATFDATKWHRIVMSVDNGSFFKVYVDGTLFLDGTAQSIDGTYSLYTDVFHLFAGDWDWSKQKWGYCATLATWDNALTSAQIADMGGWIDGATMPTALVIVPEPMTLTILALGGLLLRRNKK